VRYGVDEGVMLLIPPYLAHQKRRVQNDAADDRQGQYGSQEEQDSGTPVEQDPPDIQEDHDGDQADAERNKECDGSAAAGDNHTLSAYTSVHMSVNAARMK
jgi:hypothetical protein